MRGERAAAAACWSVVVATGSAGDVDIASDGSVIVVIIAPYRWRRSRIVSPRGLPVIATVASPSTSAPLTAFTLTDAGELTVLLALGCFALACLFKCSLLLELHNGQHTIVIQQNLYVRAPE